MRPRRRDCSGCFQTGASSGGCIATRATPGFVRSLKSRFTFSLRPLLSGVNQGRSADLGFRSTTSFIALALANTDLATPAERRRLGCYRRMTEPQRLPRLCQARAAVAVRSYSPENPQDDQTHQQETEALSGKLSPIGTVPCRKGADKQ